jgi:hypothetical protein
VFIIKKAVQRDAVVGNFDPSFYWTYYRDVDWCISARRRWYSRFTKRVYRFFTSKAKTTSDLIAQNPSLDGKMEYK